MKLTFRKNLHLTLCALLSLGVSSGSVPTLTTAELLKKTDSKTEELHYYSDVMERGDLPATCIFMPGVITLGAGSLLYMIVISALLPKGLWTAGVISYAAGSSALVAGGVVVAAIIVAYLALQAVTYISKQYSVTSPEALKATTIGMRIAKGYQHFKDPVLQAKRQAYYDDPNSQKAWDFFNCMYSVDASYFVCGEKISFYPGGARANYWFKGVCEALGYPCTSSTQDMTQEEMAQSTYDYLTWSKGTNLHYTGWTQFRKFALQILADKSKSYDKQVTAALKILEWVRNATPQNNPTAITVEAESIVAKIKEDTKIVAYLQTQNKMLEAMIRELKPLSNALEAYGSPKFEEALGKLNLDMFNTKLKEENVYQQSSALKKFGKALVSTGLRNSSLESASSANTGTGYNGAIILRKMIASKANEIQKSYEDQLLTSYTAFYPTSDLRSFSGELLDPKTSLADLNLSWLNDEKCPDVVRYGLIEMMISKFEAKYNVNSVYENSVDDLKFADDLAESCMKMLREVFKDEKNLDLNQALMNPPKDKEGNIIKNKQDVEYEAKLNEAVSNALTLPASRWSSRGADYEAWKQRYDNDVAIKTARAIKVVRIISMFFDKLFTANERDHFMGSLGSFDEDYSKRLITLTLWHLRANYPHIVSIKLEEYYKANSRWEDYISGKFSALTPGKPVSDTVPQAV